MLKISKIKKTKYEIKKLIISSFESYMSVVIKGYKNNKTANILNSVRAINKLKILIFPSHNRQITNKHKINVARKLKK